MKFIKIKSNHKKQKQPINHKHINSSNLQKLHDFIPIKIGERVFTPRIGSSGALTTWANTEFEFPSNPEVIDAYNPSFTEDSIVDTSKCLAKVLNLRFVTSEISNLCSIITNIN